MAKEGEEFLWEEWGLLPHSV